MGVVHKKFSCGCYGLEWGVGAKGVVWWCWVLLGEKVERRPTGLSGEDEPITAGCVHLTSAMQTPKETSQMTSLGVNRITGFIGQFIRRILNVTLFYLLLYCETDPFTCMI